MDYRPEPLRGDRSSMDASDNQQANPGPHTPATGLEPALDPVAEESVAPELGGVGGSVDQYEQLVSQLAGQRLAQVGYVYCDYPFSPGETDWNAYSKEIDVADEIELITETGLELSLSTGTGIEHSEGRAGYFNTGIRAEAILQPPEATDLGIVLIDVTSQTGWKGSIGETITEVRCYRGVALTIKSQHPFSYIQTIELVFRSGQVLSVTCSDFKGGCLSRLGSRLFSVFSDASARQHSVGRYSTEQVRSRPVRSGYWI